MTLFMINWERKVVARMQHRPGPNRVGPNGWLQSLADGLKLAFKEDIRPVLADKWVFFLAPVISCIPAFLAFSVIPLGPVVSIFGERTPLHRRDLRASIHDVAVRTGVLPSTGSVRLTNSTGVLPRFLAILAPNPSRS